MATYNPEIDPYRMQNPYVREGAVAHARVKKKIAVAVGALIVAAALIVGGFFAYEALRDPDFGAYADETITFSGLDDADLNITPRELYKLPCTQTTVKGTGMGAAGESKAGVVSVFGPTLRDFLAPFGVQPEDFRRIKFTCKDGYEISIRGETLTYDIYLSFASGKDALIEKQQPLRVVIPDEASGKWAYGVTRIDFYN